MTTANEVLDLCEGIDEARRSQAFAQQHFVDDVLEQGDDNIKAAFDELDKAVKKGLMLFGDANPKKVGNKLFVDLLIGPGQGSGRVDRKEMGKALVRTLKSTDWVMVQVVPASKNFGSKTLNEPDNKFVATVSTTLR